MDTEIGYSLARLAERSDRNGPCDAPPEAVGAPRSAGGRAWLQARVFNRLALVRGAVVPLKELIAAAYDASPDGGPANAANAVNAVRITILRLRCRGLRIDVVRGRGYVLM